MPSDKIDVQPDGRDDMPGKISFLIGSQLDKADLRLDGDLLEQVGGKHKRAVEDRDEQRLLTGIIFN